METEIKKHIDLLEKGLLTEVLNGNVSNVERTRGKIESLRYVLSLPKTSAEKYQRMVDK